MTSSSTIRVRKQQCRPSLTCCYWVMVRALSEADPSYSVCPAVSHRVGYTWPRNQVTARTQLPCPIFLRQMHMRRATNLFVPVGIHLQIMAPAWASFWGLVAPLGPAGLLAFVLFQSAMSACARVKSI